MQPAPVTRRRVSIAAFLAACAGTAHAGPVLVNDWLLPNSGLWSDPARWSLGVAPGIGAGVGQDARIAATGSPYTVTLNTFAAINNFTLASSNATALVTNGGVLELAGIATIGGDTDPSVGGTLVLNNGTIRGGEWRLHGAGELRVRGTQGSRIDDATVQGELLMESGSLLRVANSSIDRVRLLGNSSVLEFEGDALINGAISFEGAGTALRIVRSASPDGLIHLTGDAVVETAEGFAGRGVIGLPSYTSESIINDGRITASSGNITLGGLTITNNGTMQALNASIITSSELFDNTATIELANGVLTAGSIDSPTSPGFRNSGTLTAVDSTLNLANGITNTGTIDALRSTVSIDGSRLDSTGRFDLIDSILRVGGEFVLADLTPVTRSNSTIAIAGILRNEGQSLDLGAIPDRLTLDGGSIRGGAVIAHDGALGVSSSLNNALDGVAFSGRITLDQHDAFLRVRNGTTIEGLVEMSEGSPELRFDGSATLNNINIMMSGTQHWISSETAGQTLTFGENAVLDGYGFVNGSLPGRGSFAPFETLVNEGGWNVREGYYWQLQNTPHIVNRGTITIDPNAQLVTSTGLDLSNGLVAIAPGGELTVIQTGTTPLSHSFFGGGIANNGVFAIIANIDLQGETIALGANYGTVQLGGDFVSGATFEARNGAIHVEEGATLALEHASITLRDLSLTGGMTVLPAANATLRNVDADLVTLRGGLMNVYDSAIEQTRLEGGVLYTSNPESLGEVRFASGNSRINFPNLANDAVLGANADIAVLAGATATIRGPSATTKPWLTVEADIHTCADGRLTIDADRLRIDSTLSTEGFLTLQAESIAHLGRIELTGAGDFLMAANGGSIENDGVISLLPDPYEVMLIRAADDTFINRGVVKMGSGAILTIGADHFDNRSTIDLGGGNLTIQAFSTYSNTGLIRLDGGELTFRGPVPITSISSPHLAVEGGTVHFIGEYDLAGQTLDLNTLDGSLSLESSTQSSTLRNGVIDNQHAERVLLVNANVSNVQFTGDIAGGRLGEGVSFREAVNSLPSITLGGELDGVLRKNNGALSNISVSSYENGTRITERSAILLDFENKSGSNDNRLLIRSYNENGQLDRRDLRNEGRIEVTGNASLLSTQRVDLINAGNIHVLNGGAISLDHLSSLFNEGTITVDTVSSIGTGESFGQSENGVLHITVRNDIANTRDPALSLQSFLGGGRLEVSFADLTSLDLYQTFALIGTGSGSPDIAFDSYGIHQPTGDIRVALDTVPASAPDPAMLLAVVRHIADVNADMIVDMADLNLVLGYYGESGSLLPGDANTDGLVDFHDLNLVLTNFGMSFRAVPAPGPGMGLALGIAGLAAGRRRTPLVES